MPGTPDPTNPDHADALRWLRDYSVPAASLADLATVRTALNAVAKQLDGTPAAPSTRRRKRAIFYNVLEYGIELGQLDHNPIDRIRVRSRRRAVSQAVDRQVVANVRQVRELLTALTYVGGRIKDRGLRLVAFFACLYFAGMRLRKPKAYADETATCQHTAARAASTPSTAATTTTSSTSGVG
ncbi:MAG TPA: hypothetical protein VFC19_52830 [Candidatus Limnocylindrales bacterium]|nr:hypothetical protein [Candidatus Limnocylindrales bacterium]